MIKDEIRTATYPLARVVEEYKRWSGSGTPREEQALYMIYVEAEKFVKAFRKHELKIDD